MADDVKLKIAGQTFTGWTDVSIDGGLDALAGAFSIGLTERWPGQPEKWVIAPGQACEVLIGDDRVMTGWIDTFEPEMDDQSHTVRITGRDKTGDLVDCSAIHKPGSWSNRRLEQIAADLAKPFGIKVSASVSTGAPLSFSIQQGETVIEAIDRMTRQRGLLSTTTPAGDLEFTRAGAKRAGYALALGRNIKRIGFTNDVKDRFSDYLLKGHAGGGGDFLEGGGAATQPKASAKDPGMTRYRPLLIVNEDASSGASLSERARWEASVRVGRAQSVRVTVAGWRAEDGTLYAPNVLVPVHARELGVDAELLLVSRRFSMSARNGKLTELVLAPKEAFDLVALPDKKKKKKGKGVDALLTLQ